MTSKLWVLSASHRDTAVESLFLLSDGCLKLAKIDPGSEGFASNLLAYYFGSQFEGGSIVEAEVVVGRLTSLPLAFELRIV